MSARTFFRAPTMWSTAGTDGGYTEDQWFACLTVVQARTRDRDGQGEPLGLGRYVQFAAALASINPISGRSAGPPFRPHRRGIDDRGRPVQLTSDAAFIQHCPVQPTPQSASIHAVNRRCAVAEETSKDSGTCRHAHPLVSTYTTAVNTAPLSTGPYTRPADGT